MLTCRKCQAPAVDSRREWTNERVFIFYRHVDGRECMVSVLTLDAAQVIQEDRDGAVGR